MFIFQSISVTIYDTLKVMKEVQLLVLLNFILRSWKLLDYTCMETKYMLRDFYCTCKGT